jgi:hypothetical protein
MFIFKSEKDEIKRDVAGLRARIATLESDFILLMESVKATTKPVIKSEQAPWGHNKDGTPKKRPGRPRQTMKVGEI